MVDSIVYQPPMLARPGEITITPWSYQSLGVAMHAMGSAASAAGAVPAAGLVAYVPITVPESFTATKMFWGLGAAAGNLDAGVYALDGTLLVSTGTTAASLSASGIQIVDVTDTTLARGDYYLALVGSTVTTLTVIRSNLAAGICQSLGLLQQASVTLPLATNASPATFAKYANAYIPMVGVQGYRTIGP
jgi:hypothetical protein